MAKSDYHMYVCGGCGHTTIIDKYYKIRVNFCGVCGTKDRLEYEGPCQVEKKRKPGIFSLIEEDHEALSKRKG